MNSKILIITVFISNIAFATILPVEISQQNINAKKLNTLSKKVSMYLYNNGLDKNIAKEKLMKSLVWDDYTTDLMAKNIIKNIEQIKEENIVSYIGSSALYGKKVDLSSYGTIISLLQNNNLFDIDKNTLQKIQNTALENKSMIDEYR